MDSGEIAEKSPAFRLFHTSSRILNPLYLTPPTMLAISIRVSGGFWEGLKWFALYSLFSTIIPLGDLIIRRKLGLISDWHITIREERIRPLVFGILYAAAGTVTLTLTHAPIALVACMVTGVITAITALLITLGWKISLHAMGNSLLATLLFLVFSVHDINASKVLFTLFLALVVIFTGLSRLYIKAHTLSQIIMGTFTGVGVGVAVFAAFGIL